MAFAHPQGKPVRPAREDLAVSELRQALHKHGSAVEAIRHEPFEMWPIGEAMALIAQMARELADAEKSRREHE